jgi:phosphate transporter
MSYRNLKKLASVDHIDLSQPGILEQELVDVESKHSNLPICVICISVIFYSLPIFQIDPTSHTCLTIILLSCLLWATEIIPSYITAFLAIGLSVWFQVGYDDLTGFRMTASSIASDLSKCFFDPIILLFLGSLTISAALTKLEITDRFSEWLLLRISPKPKLLLFCLMSMNFLLSSFLSNVASTTILLTFSLPIIRLIDPEDHSINSLLLGLAWSGNTGGVLTPISSTQNIICIKFLTDELQNSVSFLKWIGIGFPVGLVNLLVQWCFLIYFFKTNLSEFPKKSNQTSFSD